MVKLRDILKLFSKNQLISLSDEQGSQLPYGHRDRVSELNDLLNYDYKDAEVVSMKIIADVLYIRIDI